MRKQIIMRTVGVLLLAGLIVLELQFLNKESPDTYVVLENDTIIVEAMRQLEQENESVINVAEQEKADQEKADQEKADQENTNQDEEDTTTKKDYIKWVDFTVSYEALCTAYQWDVDTYESEHHAGWIELLAYTAAKTGGNFDKNALEIISKTAESICDGECTMEELTKDLQYYPYYLEAYTAVLGGLVGEYREEYVDENGNIQLRDQYGLKAYFPLAKGFDYSHYDDFGVSRSYGYKRRHLGHDMMGQTGTPIIAVESGVVEALGWNQYGGWRIGIRSFDKSRYYYYAHLRQNYPFAEHLEEGSIVTAGDVIGYMGHTGYSTTENVNNIEVTHLHWGLELIFDESQKESDNEIWIDIYPLTRFLAKHAQQTQKVEGTKEWIRSTTIIDPAVEAYEAVQDEQSQIEQSQIE